MLRVVWGVLWLGGGVGGGVVWCGVGWVRVTTNIKVKVMFNVNLMSRSYSR